MDWLPGFVALVLIAWALMKIDNRLMKLETRAHLHPYQVPQIPYEKEDKET